MAYLTRDEILTVQDLPCKDVEVPEWDGMVRMRGLNAAEAAAFTKRLVHLDANGNVRAMEMDNFMAELLALVLINEDGERMFSKDDVEALGRKSANILKRLFEVAAELSGLGDEAIGAAAKN